MRAAVPSGAPTIAPPSPSDPACRPLRRSDLPSAARLHGQELGEGFISQLGPRFLRCYLSTFLDVPGGVALAVDGPDGSFAGFVVGSTRSHHHRAALRSHGPRLALAAALALPRRPRLLRLFLRTRLRRYLRVLWALMTRRGAPPGSTGGATPAPSRDGVLLHVAVSEQGRGQGLGRALVRALESAARADGCTSAVLVSFGDKPFFERIGWSATGRRHNEAGQPVVTYRRAL